MPSRLVRRPLVVTTTILQLTCSELAVQVAIAGRQKSSRYRCRKRSRFRIASECPVLTWFENAWQSETLQ